MNENELEWLMELRISNVYLHSNEGLDAVVAGLDIHPTDSVLAICGSGDQSFAMLEFAKEVAAIDNDRTTLEYAILRKKLLKESDFDRFLSKDEKKNMGYVKGINDAEYAKVINYFTHQRLEAIRSRLDDLQFQEADILAYLEANPKKFSKIYLSNALTYLEKNQIDSEALNLVARASNPGTLIYVSHGRELDYPALQTKLRRLEIEKEFTLIARDKEESRLTRCFDEHHSPHKWTPVVLRVI